MYTLDVHVAEESSPIRTRRLRNVGRHLASRLLSINRGPELDGPGGETVDVEEVIRRVSADLEVAEAQLRAAEGRVNELRAIRDGLQYALQRYGRQEAEAHNAQVAAT